VLLERNAFERRLKEVLSPIVSKCNLQ
jgi:hypothetical protein